MRLMFHLNSLKIYEHFLGQFGRIIGRSEPGEDFVLTGYHSEALANVSLNHFNFCFAVGHGEIVSLYYWLLLPSQRERGLRLISSIQDFTAAADRHLRKRNECNYIAFLNPKSFGDCCGAG